MKNVGIIGLSGNSLFYEVDHLPKNGESIKANNLHTEVGGKGFNQAVACRRAGLNVFYLSSVGNDDVSLKCEEVLDNEGINYLLVKKNINTASASILRSNDGSNEVIVFDGANKLLDKNDLKEFDHDLKDTDGILLTYEISLEIIKEVINSNNEKFIVLNPAPYIYDDREILSKVDIVSPNETEVMQMFDLEQFDLDLIRKKSKEFNIKTLVITCGEKGCAIVKEDSINIIDGEKVDCVDTTGAGDVFNAYLMSGMLNGKDIIEACKYANHMAAISTTKKYVMDAIPKRDINE